MHLLALLLVPILAKQKLKGPVEYSYVAVAVAFFDAKGQQVAQKFQPRETATVPARFPRTGEVVPSSVGDFKVTGELGKGTDSTVFRAVQVRGSLKVAIKFQIYPDSDRANSVETDYRILSLMAHMGFGSRFPQVHYLSELGSVVRDGETLNMRYLVMELLGSSVWTLTKKFTYALPMPTIASVGIQCIDILQQLHSTGLIHGDIHLENILFVDGLADEEGRIFTDRVVLGDYGRSTYFIDPSTGTHIPDETIVYSEKRNLLFLSPFELALGTPSRREDIFRLMETLARMVNERKYSDTFRKLQTNREAILHAKRTTHLTDIFPNIAPEFDALYNYSRSLGFTEEPDYSRLRQGFLAILASSGVMYADEIILP